MEQTIRLIVGLGNPGKAYELTRHNVGFEVIRKIASEQGWTFKYVANLSGDVAQGIIEDQKIMLLQPATYMNSSGRAVRMCMDYFKIDLRSILVISDDVYLPFGVLRFRKKGSAGGHKGLLSIEQHLGTQEYSRLKIGIDGAHHAELADYVLGSFNKDEMEKFPEVCEEAVSFVKEWIKEKDIEGDKNETEKSSL